MNRFDGLLKALAAREAKPSRLVARLVLTRLRESGVEVPPGTTLDELERSVADALRAGKGSKNITFNIGPASESPDVPIVDVSDIDEAGLARELQRAMDEQVAAATQVLADDGFRRIKREAARGLMHSRHDALEAFERRLTRHWRKPLHLLAVEIAAASEIGAEANSWLRRRTRGREFSVVDALTRLQARACRTAREVETLLRSGYADGALARWRTLHEIVVVGLLIAEKGAGLATRYLDHLVVDSLRLARKDALAAQSLGTSATLGAPQRRSLSRRMGRLLKKYGPGFKHDYGWASAELGKTKPTFADLEAAVDFEAFRIPVHLANTNVHAGSKAIYFSLCALPGDPSASILLTGPSNAGLEEAGRLTALSLAQVTIALLTVNPTLEALVWSRILLHFSREVADRFIVEGQRLSRRDTRIRQRRGRRETK